MVHRGVHVLYDTGSCNKNNNKVITRIHRGVHVLYDMGSCNTNSNKSHHKDSERGPCTV